MITILENSITKKKNTLNLVDNNGRVLGFKPRPNNVLLKYQFRNSDGHLVSDETCQPLERYLIGSPFHFGRDISFVPSDIDGELTAMNIDLISDKLGLVNELHIEGVGAEYYVEDIGLSNNELSALFSDANIEQWRKTSAWRPLYPYELVKPKKTWEVMSDKERIETLLKRIEKLEEKVNILGNLK